MRVRSLEVELMVKCIYCMEQIAICCKVICNGGSIYLIALLTNMGNKVSSCTYEPVTVINVVCV